MTSPGTQSQSQTQTQSDLPSTAVDEAVYAVEDARLPPGESKAYELRITHRTTYTYGEYASRSLNQVRLDPVHSPWQVRKFFLLTVRPAARLQSYYDFNRNKIHFFEVNENHTQLIVEAQSVVHVSSKYDLAAFPYGFLHDDLHECREMDRLYPFIQPSHYVELTPEIWKAAVDARGSSDDVFETCYNIMRWLNETFEYVPGVTQVTTSAVEAFTHKKGVCQDFAHVMLAMCRSLGIPSRYVSGYVYDPSHDHRLRGAQASHAWVEVFIKGRGGWFGLDPTNKRVVDEHYVMLAVGRDYQDVAPVSGTFYGGGAHRTLNVALIIERLA